MNKLSKINREKIQPLTTWSTTAVYMLILIGHLFHPLAADAAPVESAWKLVLDHSSFGRCTAVFSENRIRFDDGIMKRLILPPYKVSYLFNAETKKVMQASNSTFENLTGINYKSASVKKIGSDRLLGLMCTHYSLALPGRRSCEYWATHDIKMNPKLAILCCQLGCAPPGYGTPVRVIWKDRRGREERLYSVLKLEKCALRSSDFLPPEGYTTARDLFELHFCNKETKYVDAVDNAFMLDYSPEKKRKRRN
ncbi:MAG: DUF4412 domain-containing protein [Candidatus Obscuribacterales bacterium]|nr:DUF4412 domain-containing protein [Candidatus Obscuribacterales bacterium]